MKRTRIDCKVRPWGRHRMVVATLMAMVLIGARNPIEAKPPRGGGGDGGSTSVSYDIIRLAEADGMVTAINHAGEAVGWIETVAGHQAMSWQPATDGTYAGLPLSSTIGSGETAITFMSLAQDVSDDGVIAGVLGESLTGLGGWRPAIWFDAASQPKILPIGSLVFPDAYVEGGALGICKSPASQSGLKAIVVGRYMEYPEGVVDGAVVIVHAVAWPVTTSDQLLAPVELAIVNSRAGSEFETVAIDVNSSLQVVGTVASETSIYKHAYRWQLSWDSTRQQLSSDNGSMLFPTRQWSSALAINESGDICGERAGNARPFLLKRSGSGYVDQALVSPPAPKSEYYSLHTAKALNGNSTPQVIGNSTVYTSRGGFVRFTDVMWQASSAWDLEKVTPISGIETDYMTSINDSGVIGGQGWEGSLRRKPPILLFRQ